MCGIAGEINFESGRQESGALERMLEVLRFRGPDEQGVMHGDGWTLGARRLSIVGRENGSQPFVGQHGTICVFNGEIYNFEPLRAQLEDAGVRLGTRTDGEVIVHLYEQVGLDFIHCLRGMFALAIYDPRRRRLILGRDRIGKKPLFYAHEPGRRVVFGSSLNAVLGAGGIPRRIDPDAIDYYLSYRIIPAPHTIYRDVRKVEPGCLNVIDAGGTQQIRYWSYPLRDSAGTPGESELAGKLRGLVESAVATRIPAEVSHGVFLSGGLDSTLVAALVKHHNRPLRTFSVGFAQSAFDERPYARQVARALGASHTEYEITPADALHAVEELTWHFGEPFGFPSSIACFYMSRLAREQVTVVLGGDGADELFAGYRRYRRLLQITGRAASACRDPLDTPEAIARDYEPVLIDGLRTDWKLELLAPDFIGRLPQPYPVNRLTGRIRAVPGVEYLNRILALDGAFWLTDAQMCKVDVTSMAHSLEVRHPLLDESIVDFAADLPTGLKLREGQEKYLLHRVAADLVPQFVLQRPKQELAVPLEDWLTGQLRAEMIKTLTAPASLERGYFQPDRLRRFVEDFDGIRSYAIWTLYMLERWHLRHHDARFD